MSDLSNINHALVLSGGGAKGKYQVGALKVLTKMFDYDYISGVSVGALNAAMLATANADKLLDVWLNIRGNKDIYKGGFKVFNMIRILFGQRYWYSNKPLVRLMWEHLDLDNCHTPFSVGVVSLNTGRYLRYTYRPNGVLTVSNRHEIIGEAKGEEAKERMFDAILASTAIPVAFPPVKSNEQLYVDGGARDVSPLSDAIYKQPNHITIINCSRHNPSYDSISMSRFSGLLAILRVATRSLDIVMSEIIRNDIAGFLNKNHIVKQTDAPVYNKNGKEYKYFKHLLIEPTTYIGDTLDFSPDSISRGINVGIRDASKAIEKTITKNKK